MDPRFECTALRFLPVVALVGTFVLTPGKVRAVDPAKAITQYVQSAWNSEDGLPQNSVHAVAQTADGFLWMGTEEGLARFDGVKFTVFTSHYSHGLKSDYIQALGRRPRWQPLDRDRQRAEPLGSGARHR